VIVCDEEYYGPTAVSADLARATSLDDLADRLSSYDADVAALEADGEIEAAKSLRLALTSCRLPTFGPPPDDVWDDDTALSWDYYRILTRHPVSKKFEILVVGP
jgi:hypothetical protein